MREKRCEKGCNLKCHYIQKKCEEVRKSAHFFSSREVVLFCMKNDKRVLFGQPLSEKKHNAPNVSGNKVGEHLRVYFTILDHERHFCVIFTTVAKLYSVYIFFCNSRFITPLRRCSRVFRDPRPTEVSRRQCHYLPGGGLVMV